MGEGRKLIYEGYFGKNQRLVSITAFLLYQAIFYFTLAFVGYSVFTLQFQFIVVLGILSILQIPIGRSQRYVDLVNKYIIPTKYFEDFQINFEEQIKTDQKCLFGVHPHSVFALSLLFNMNFIEGSPVSRMVGLSSRFMLNFPIVGILLKLWGVQAVNNQNVKRLMKEGRNIGLLPGGFQEATITTRNELRVYIESRKGFIKYAMENNYTIYPMIMMNEHQAYWTFQYLLDFRLFLNKLKFPGILYWNAWTGLFLPTSLRLHTVVGRGIRNHWQSEGRAITKEQIDSLHKEYIDEIVRIYEKYRHLNGDRPLKIY